MNEACDKIRVTQPKYKVGQYVRISKAKLLFAKVGEQNYRTEIFRIIKVISRVPRPLYELEDLNHKVIEGQFLNEELTPVRPTKQTEFKIDKILVTRRRRGILQYLVCWKGYTSDFDNWINAASLKKI